MNDVTYTFEDLIQFAGRLRWLLLVAGCVALVIYAFAMKRRALRSFASPELLPVLAPDVSRTRQYVKAGLLLTAMLLTVIALAGPRWGVFWRDVEKRRLDIVVCLDVSKSMLAEDAGMSRLSRAKDDIKRLTENLTGGMIGLVTFAGRGELTCPLTDDYEFYRMALDDVGIHSVPLGGTNLGSAIQTALQALSTSKNQDRVILLVTDGEDQGGTAIADARAAHEKGINIYTIGIGDPDRGALIPIEKEGQKTFVMYEGQQHWSKMNEDDLKKIATAGGGEYHPSKQVTPRQRTIEWVYTERIDPRVKRSSEDKLVRAMIPRFHWFATLALVLLIAEPLVGERRAGGKGEIHK